MTGAEVLMTKFVCDMAVMLDENAALKRKIEELTKDLLDRDCKIAELDAKLGEADKALLEAAAEAQKPSVILRARGQATIAGQPVYSAGQSSNMATQLPSILGDIDASMAAE